MCMSISARTHAEQAAMAQNELKEQTQWREAIKRGQDAYVEGQERIIGSRHPEIIKASQQLVSYLDASSERRPPEIYWARSQVSHLQRMIKER
jgi:hypothetical protein